MKVKENKTTSYNVANLKMQERETHKNIRKRRKVNTSKNIVKFDKKIKMNINEKKTMEISKR